MSVLSRCTLREWEAHVPLLQEKEEKPAQAPPEPEPMPEAMPSPQSESESESVPLPRFESEPVPPCLVKPCKSGMSATRGGKGRRRYSLLPLTKTEEMITRARVLRCCWFVIVLVHFIQVRAHACSTPTKPVPVKVCRRECRTPNINTKRHAYR